MNVNLELVVAAAAVVLLLSPYLRTWLSKAWGAMTGIFRRTPADDATLDAEAFARLLARAAIANPEAAKLLIDMRAKLLGGAA